MASSSCAGQQALDALLSIVEAADKDFKLYDKSLLEADAPADDLAVPDCPAEPDQDPADDLAVPDNPAEPDQDKGSDTEPSISEDRMKADANEIECPLGLAVEGKRGDQCDVDEANWYRHAGAGNEHEDLPEDDDEAGDEDEDLPEDDDDIPKHLRKPAPWSVQPNKRGRSSNLTEEELAGLRHEEALAQQANLSWQERGPSGEERPEHWRGQKLRQGKEGGKVRYSNRGGTKRELYAELARKGKLKPTKGGTGKGNSKPNSKSTKSGKGKH
jgi:hypothetical protein